ncbi:uncharacterized protein BP5553_04330 [Venustampulla echinocandica]|uniref:G-patch domain-containing protein n=1 Tax=Venustampulla echinocandica TaxID=2656787 RepID=A0A370TWT5_9HELO|nr:uncharacterized protein BP5553_04330 [Venustampulla echinocandica]RDL39990.1 hypothetical protein BP5553_04330 [Venustampulla echinocandica]
MSDEDTYEIPLQDQRVFGAGIKRKRVQFVPSTSTAPAVPTSQTSGKSISDLYLKLVLPEDPKTASNETVRSRSAVSDSPATGRSKDEESLQSHVCDICNLPLSAPLDNNSTSTTRDNLENAENSGCLNLATSKPTPHEASLAHQVCLEHSHPPSHLDRKRKGLAYLSSYGWDPDSRLGLGASGQGIQYPIKTKPKDDKLGIGVVLPKDGEIKKKVKPETLDAKKMKKLYYKDRRKSERLREMFYRNDDVERYLGTN